MRGPRIVIGHLEARVLTRKVSRRRGLEPFIVFRGLLIAIKASWFARQGVATGLVVATLQRPLPYYGRTREPARNQGEVFRTVQVMA